MKAIVRWWKSDSSLWHMAAANLAATFINACIGTPGRFDAAINATFAFVLAVLLTQNRNAQK